MEEIQDAGPGDIAAVFALDCHFGHTFTDGKSKLAMASSARARDCAFGEAGR